MTPGDSTDGDFMRLGIFGGSFDPVHRGHLVLAESCLEQARLDQVWFVPAARQPFKPDGPLASDADRLAMLQLALNSHSAFEICPLEINRGGISYTIDTLLAIKLLQSEAQLFLLMGADALDDFPHWQQPEEICRLATLIVVNRAGQPAPNLGNLASVVSSDRLAEIEECQVTMPPMEISSSEIRRFIAAGGEWQHMVPTKVAQYIRDHNLYQVL